MKFNIIAAVSENGAIGDADLNSIPWQGRYPEDFKFFKQMTIGGEVIFGRKTFESIGKPLAKRHNIVITRKTNIEGVSCFTSIEDFKKSRALVFEDQATIKWICGGANIYREGMKYATEIYLTLIPEIVNGNNLVYFPWIDPSKFKIEEFISIENSELKVARYVQNIYNYL